MFREPETFALLLDKLATVMAEYLHAQVAAGARALQVFDSWVGALSPGDYEERVLPFTRRIFESTASLDVPRIHFGTSTAGLLDLIAESGADVISLDWRIDLDEGWERVGHHRGVQGNLDPAVLLGPPAGVVGGARRVLRVADGRPGTLFTARRARLAAHGDHARASASPGRAAWAAGVRGHEARASFHRRRGGRGAERRHRAARGPAARAALCRDERGHLSINAAPGVGPGAHRRAW